MGPHEAVRVGLLRHFPVEQAFPRGLKTAAELKDWLERYDRAAIRVGPFDLGGVDWQQCLASDLPRARATAAVVFTGPVECTPLLREAQFAGFRTGNLRLPTLVWRWWVRLCWLTGHRSQRACRDDFLARMTAAADRLCAAHTDTLVVSHAGMMLYLGDELRRRGFKGPRVRMAKHAQAYVYER